ncbi:MAG TPA: hypothetical protein VGO16_03265 [Pseudonocardiaceae bacterium]|nr:hypothetical protein [Pseudonocardiaceae bacterium]
MGMVAPFAMFEPCHHFRRRSGPELIGPPNHMDGRCPSSAPPGKPGEQVNQVADRTAERDRAAVGLRDGSPKRAATCW